MRDVHTNKNELLHSGQGRLCRKDLNFGDASAYKYAMAVGVLKKSLGNQFLLRLSDKIGAKLSPRAKLFIASKDKARTTSQRRRKLRAFKAARNKQQVSLKARKHPACDENSYLGNGKALGNLSVHVDMTAAPAM